jgi:hypothetical protein
VALSTPRHPPGIAEHGDRQALLSRDAIPGRAAYHFPSNSWWAALLPIRGELIDLVFVFFWNFSMSRKATGIDDYAIDFGFTDLDSGCATQDQRNRLIVLWLTL